MSGEFNLHTWSDSIPLCEDLWLGMQARNIALVDLGIIRDMEADALENYMEHERTPIDILLVLSALSQMWVFALYEFLRTWRQRADELIRISARYSSAPSAERDKVLATELEKARKKEKFIRAGFRNYSENIEQITDPLFIENLTHYRRASESLFRRAELLRVTLAKHEIPKTDGFVAEAPGYGRMSYTSGSIYWFLTLKDGSQTSVNRRDLSNEFLNLDPTGE